MIAELIPASKLKRNLWILDYNIPKTLDIKIGDLVEIKIKNKTELAVVYKIKNTSPYPNLKNIGKRIEGFNYSKTFLNTLINIADYLFYPPSAILKHSLILKAQKKYKINNFFEENKNSFSPQYKLELNKNIFNEFSYKFNKYLILNNKKELEYQFYLEYIKKAKKKQKTTLFLFPNIKNIEEFKKHLGKEYKYYTINNNIYKKKNLFYELSQKIKNKEYDFILANRSIIFYPFLEYFNTIIVNEAENDDYKQEEQSPRYHTIDLLYIIQKTLKFKLILFSLSPRLLDFYFSQKLQNFKLINNYQSFTNTSYWVYLNFNKLDSNTHPLIEPELENKIINDYRKNISSIIIHNKTGYSKYIKCKNCENILQCPKCQNSLKYDNTKKELYCDTCNFKSSQFHCPKCKHTEFKAQIYGIEQIYNYFKKKYSNIYFSKFLRENKTTLQNTPQICIASNYFFSSEYLKYFSNIIITKVEQILNINDFNSHWKSFNYLNKIIQLSSENNINLYLETFNPNFFIFKYLRNNKIYNFYKTELEWRKEYNYPPYKQLVKIIFKKEYFKDINKIKKIYQDLKNFDIHLYPIYENNNFIIIFKTNYNKLKKNTLLYNYLFTLDNNCIIDINPNNLYK